MPVCCALVWWPCGWWLQDKGLNCRLVIANRPFGAPVTDRAIPTVIFKAEPAVQTFWLRKWLKTTASVALRDVIDWQYYNERLGKTIAKIITIPAALQGVPNPVPRVVHPEWLQRKVRYHIRVQPRPGCFQATERAALLSEERRSMI